MKYGETLPQRSIPEWGPYNVDYNDLKRLIKLRTTEDQPRAVDICGQGRRDTGALQAFEDELYGELVEQFQRIDLFVQSKAGEIQRRLDHLDKQIARLNKRDFPAGRQRISVRRLEKFSKAEEDVLRAGEEVRSLSRFIGAQRLAFHKLLKKYAKWTQSSSLLKRFLKVLDQPASFSRRDLQPLVLQWTEVLAAVREPFKDGMAFKADYGERKPSLTPVQNPVDGTGHGEVSFTDGNPPRLP
ncbi:MAG: hypothetical protein M1832_002998 [Thelocarpon impressellum]|nr:MAG: hypothetical protein M1832_002998 [Thelocarpon impressellum]